MKASEGTSWYLLLISHHSVLSQVESKRWICSPVKFLLDKGGRVHWDGQQHQEVDNHSEGEDELQQLLRLVRFF